jgi:murein L,D-transpeptidase YafK
MKRTFALIFLLLVSCPVFAGYFEHVRDYLKDYKKKYFIYVYKPKKKLFLMDRQLVAWKAYTVATGEKNGEKLYAGDRKTPSGVYHITEIYQYREPWYLPQIKEKMAAYKEDPKKYGYYYGYYKKFSSKHKKAIQRIRDLNNVYLSAEEGHAKYGTDEDLGFNAYGPVFMRLDYPNSNDVKKYKKAVAMDMIPQDEDGEYIELGGGIAIHGTNDNPSLGFDASAGCVRMKNRDIEELSDYVSEGTIVVIE